MPSLASSAEAPLPAPPAGERLGFALFLALCLHAILILGATLAPPPPSIPSQALEVVLVAPPGAAQPEPPPAPATREVPPVEMPVAEAPATEVRQPSERESPPSPVTEAAPPAPPERRNYAALSEQIAALGLAMANEAQAGAGAPRLRQLSSRSDKSAVEAAYLELWRTRVERIGTANYPGNRVAGELRMQVVIRDDGALLDARIIEPSGAAAVDAAALRIVQLAAPFAEFPVEMRKAYDRLEITRTWRFSRTGARLGD